MEQFKMIRNVVSKSSFKEADDHVTFYKDKSALVPCLNLITTNETPSIE